jgi:hypothetical protein
MIPRTLLPLSVLTFGAGLELVMLSSCSDAPEADERIGLVAPNASQEAFGPVADFIGHRCGTLDCHGRPERNFRVWSCEGMRLAATDVSICSRPRGGRRTTPEERQATYRSLVGLEPVVMSNVVQARGAHPELLTFVRKARGLESHVGGALIVPGDDQDVCITSWLAGQTNLRACGRAFANPVFPPTAPSQ